MYAEFFGLSQPPFSIAPDPRFLFMSERHREALAHLLYGTEGGGGFVLLTGEIGAGKTTICRSFLDRLPDRCQVAYIFNPKLTSRELLQTICEEFGIAKPANGFDSDGMKPYVDALNQYLLQQHAQGRRAILIIDEAQNLSVDVLEQLRLLTNLETRESKLLQIMLIGQPELRDMLARADMQQLAQRVTARYHLGPLNEAETREYIRQRLKVAGRTGPLPFTDKALRVIHRLTGGVPRRINLLCDRALLGAYSGSLDTVTDSIVRVAATEAFGEGFEAKSGQASAKLAPWHRWLAWSLPVVAAGLILGLGLGPQSSKAPEAPSPPSPPAAAASVSTALSTDLPTALPTDQAAKVNVGAAPHVVDAWSDDIVQSLPTDEDAAWPVLSMAWGVSAEGTSDPCATLQQQHLQCFRTNRMTLDGLKTLDRPAILTLTLPGQGTRRAVVVALNTTHALVEGTGAKQWWVPVSLLEDHWQGQYATLWRTPPGTSGRISRITTGEGLAWVESRFAELQKAGKLDSKAKTLKDQTLAFQRQYGVETHGDISTLTLLRLNMVVGVDEPRLPALATGSQPSAVGRPAVAAKAS